MRRINTLLVAGLLILTIATYYKPAPVSSQPVKHQKQAEVLQALGLFAGTNRGFELEKQPSRAESAVMLVHMLGKAELAREQPEWHPFKDVPDWADPYVGYLYARGLTSGTGPDTFSPQANISAVEYMALILRVLGYDDRNADFQWKASLKKGQKIGLIDETDRKFLEEAAFRRDEMVWISYQALGARLKDLNYTLIEKLIAEGVVIENARMIIADNSYNYETAEAAIPTYYIYNPQELQSVLQTAIENLQTQFILAFKYSPANLTDDFKTAINQAEAAANSKTGLTYIRSWSYEGDGQQLNVAVKYAYNQEKYQQLQSRARQIVEKTIHLGMDDYDKAKALHDYIVNNTIYDYSGLKNGKLADDSFTAYGVLVLGRGVCQGYAESMDLLCQMAGLECILVKGEALSSGQWIKHAWNLVKIDGSYYHVDTTFDDPIITGGKQVLLHKYFLLSDSEIEKDHRWDR